MSPESAEQASEADWLCPLIEHNAEPLKAAQLGPRFRLEGASFRLYASARNTIYQVSGRFDWFLKLPRTGNVGPMARERLGAETIGRVLHGRPEYGGATLTRVATDPAYVLAATIPGRALNKIVLSKCWVPGAAAVAQLDQCFQTLGSLIAAVHTHARVDAEAPGATTRPFETLKSMLTKVTRRDKITDAISEWYEGHKRSDAGDTFVHGNFRMDNVLVAGDRLGFVDFENCGTGSFYQDLSRPVSELLLTRALVAFPHNRASHCLKSFLAGYRHTHPYDPAQLWDHVAVRQARFYLETRGKRFFETTVGGLPLMPSKLDSLTLAVLHERFDTVMPELFH